MRKKIIAVDIDDVLSVHAEVFITYSNALYKTNLTVDDYNEHWSELWGVDYKEVERRVMLYHESGVMSHYERRAQSRDVLGDLAQNYTLVVITSRKSATAESTKAWLEQNYPGIFKDLYHAGMWDKVTEGSITATKAELCRDVGANYLIDDQLKHCLATARLGIRAVLFGDYAWNQARELPGNVVRCADWAAVKEYFYDKRRH